MRFTCFAAALLITFLLSAPVFAAFPFSFGGVNDADPTATVDIDSNSDNIDDMAVTPQGDLLVAGHFEGEAIDFSPHNSTVDVVRSSSLADGTYRESGFLASYSGVTSQLNWVAYAHSDCSVSVDDWEAVTADANAIYLAGGFCGNTTIFDGAGQTTTLRTSDDIASPGDTSSDIFVAKFSHEGGLLWVETFGGPEGSDDAQSIDVDADGNLYVAGRFRGTVVFGSGNSFEGRWYDGFVLSLAADRSLRWVKRLGGADEDGIETVEVDGSAVYINAYVTSQSSGVHLDDDDETLEFNPTVAADDGSMVEEDAYFSVIQRLNSADGTLVWSAPIMRPDSTENTYIYVSDMSIGGDAAVYLTGFFAGSADVNPSPTTVNAITAATADDYDGFVLKLASTGTFAWATAIGQGLTTDTGDAIYATQDASPSIFVTGDYANTIDADGRGLAGAGSGTDTITSAGDRDVFLTKLDGNGDLVWVRSIGGTEYDTGDSLAGGADDVVYFGGQFRKEADIDPTDAVVTVSTADYAAVGDNTEGLAGRDAFIVRLTESTGEVLPADSDNDGIDDDTEVSVPPYTDPNDPDSDGDGIDDGTEVSELNTDPTNPDSDGDGVTDGVDVYPLDSSRWVAAPIPLMPLPFLLALVAGLGWLGMRRFRIL